MHACIFKHLNLGFEVLTMDLSSAGVLSLQTQPLSVYFEVAIASSTVPKSIAQFVTVAQLAEDYSAVL